MHLEEGRQDLKSVDEEGQNRNEKEDLTLSSSVSQIIKELCSSYSFHFRHLYFNGITKEVISSQNMTDAVDFLTKDII